MALMTPFVQTRLVDYFTRILEERTGTTISIGRVEFRPIESLVLNDVFVQDCRKDTLVFCERLVMRVDSVSFVKRRFTITEAAFENAKFNLWIERRQDGRESLTNVEQLISSFSSSKVDTEPTVSSEWNVNLTQVILKNCLFRYIENEYEPTDYGINWTDVECQDLNVRISGIDFTNKQYKAKVSDLSFREKSGFQVSNMRGEVIASDDNLLITNTLIQTKRSKIYLDTLEYNWVPEHDYWRNFTSKMQQRYVFTDSRVHFDDLAYFNGKLLGMHNTIFGSGVVFNTINNLEGRDLELYLGDKSVLHGSFSSHGLPSFFETDFNIDFKDTKVSPPELEAIYMPWLKSHYVKIPEILHKYDTFNFEGNFEGRIEDFVVKARSTTPGMEGNVIFNCVLDSIGDIRYDGWLGLGYVQFGFLTEQSFLGRGAFFGKFDGVLGDSTSHFNMSSNIRRLQVFDRNIRDIQLTLGTRDEHLYLLSSVKNDSLQADVILDYIMGDTLSLAKAEGYVNVRQWDTWAPSILGERESFEFDFSGTLKQNEENRWIELLVPDLKYENSRGEWNTDSLSLVSTILGEYSFTQLQSDIADVTMEGFFHSLDLTDLWNSFVVSYLPAYKYAVDKPLPQGTSLTLDVHLNDVNPLLNVAYPQLKLSRGGNLACEYNYADRQVKLSLAADTISYGDLKLYDSQVKLDGDGANLHCIYSADEIKYLNLGKLYNVRNVMEVNTNNVSERLTWCNWERESYSGSFAANLRLLKYGERYLTQVFIHPSTIVMADSTWHVARSMILKEDNDIFVNNFEISRGEQHFRLKGRVSDNPRDVLSLEFNDFSLTEFNKILFDNKLQLFGQVNGQVRIQDLYKDNLIYANVNVDQWGINRDTLGTLNLNSRWDASNSALEMSVVNQMKERTPVGLFGYYKPSVDSLDMNLALSQIEVNYLASYFPEMLKGGEGTVSGSLNMKGTTQKTSVNGYLEMDSVALVVAGLNTAFKVDERLPVKNNRVVLDNFKIYDAKGHASVCSGYYDLSSNLYDVSLQFDNFRVLILR